MSADLLLKRFSRLDAAADDFLLACEAKRLAPKTVRNYRDAIVAFVAFAGDVPPDRIDAPLLRRWQRDIALRDLSATTQGTYLRRVKTWLTWLADEDIYDFDAAVLGRVKSPRSDSEQPHPFTTEEMVKLFAACNRNGWLGQRMRAMMACLLDTGVRASELCGLRLADVDLKQATIFVRAETSKSRRERSIALGQRGKSEMGRWWFKKREQMTQVPGSAFFCTNTGRALGQDQLTRLVNVHGRKSGLVECHPHKFRHTFAVMSLKEGMSPSALMAILGHSSFAMTQRYILLAEADVSTEKRAKSYLDKLRLR